MNETLRECEIDIEATRGRLARDLATLRAPETLSAFSDSAMRQIKGAANSKLSELVEELKGKAAANPAATLAIGAGLVWQFIRNPPIATALVGAGVISLWRAQAVREPSDAAYIDRAKETLRNQATHLGTYVSEKAAKVARTVAAEASQATSAGADKVSGWVEDTTRDLRQLNSSTQEAVVQKAQSLSDVALQAFHDGTDQASHMTSDAAEAIGEAAQEARQASARGFAKGRKILNDAAETAVSLQPTDAGDKLLLGLAGIAVAAALGIAYQKRNLES